MQLQLGEHGHSGLCHTPHTESKRAVKQLIRYLKCTQHTCLRLEPRGKVQKGLLELVGRNDSDWAGDSATRQSVTGYHCNAQGVTMCNRSLKQTAISLSSCEAEFYAASANFWDSQSSSRNCTTTFQFVSRWIQIRHDTFHSAEDQADSSTSKLRCLAIQQWIREKRLSVQRVDTKDNTADLFTKPMDGPRTQSLARKFGLRILQGTNDD